MLLRPSFLLGIRHLLWARHRLWVVLSLLLVKGRRLLRHLLLLDVSRGELRVRQVGLAVSTDLEER